MTGVPTIRDFMDKSFITFHKDTDVYKAIDILLDSKITGAAVVDEKGKLCGVLSEKDCLRTLTHGVYHSLPGGKVSEYMTENPETISAELDVFTVADMFLKRNFRRLLVVENDELVGQITRRDLLRAIQQIKHDQ